MKRLIPFFILFFFLVAAIVPSFKPYVSGTADGLGHRFRLVSFYTSLSEGNIRPRWSREAALGYGAPLFLFNYPLPYYIASFFLFLGFSVNTSGQLLGALSLFFSGIGMYVLCKKLTGSAWGGLVAGVIYTYAPYHLQMMYLYDAWGEILAFVFPPWILYIMLNIQTYLQQNQILNIKNQKHISKSKNIFDISSVYFIFNFLFLILFWFLFILSHNVSVLMFTPVLILLSILMASHSFSVLTAFVLAILLSSFFWLPALILSKDLRYLDFIGTEGALRGGFFKPLIPQIATAVKVIQEGVTYYLDFTIGLPILFVGIIQLFIFIFRLIQNKIKEQRLKIKNTYQKENIFDMSSVFLLFYFLSFIFLLPESNWFWQFPPFTFILYPFRFLFLSTFIGAILGGFLASRSRILAILLLLSALIQGRPYLSPYADIFPFPDSYFGQTQTFSAAPGTKKNMLIKEFLPKTAHIAFLEEEEKTMQNKKEGEIIQGRGRIKNVISQTAQRASFAIEAQEPVLLTLSRFYFPNWRGFIDGNETPLHVDQVGRMNLEVPEGIHTVQFVFGLSDIEKLANGISLIGIILIAIQIAIQIMWFKRRQKIVR